MELCERIMVSGELCGRRARTNGMCGIHARAETTTVKVVYVQGENGSLKAIRVSSS